MSAVFLNVAKIQIKWGYAALDMIQGWQDKNFLTASEADQARAYWHETHPDPEPEPDPPTGDTASNTSDTQLKTD